MPGEEESAKEADEEAVAWTEVLDDAGGASYFYNTFTGESTWDRPAALDTLLALDGEAAEEEEEAPRELTELEVYEAWETVEAGSTVYYYNPVLNESSFEKPIPPASAVELEEALNDTHRAVTTVYETDGTFNDLVSLTELSGGTAFAEDWAHGTDMSKLMEELEAKVKLQIEEEERQRLLEERVKEPEQVRKELFVHAATGGDAALKELELLADEYPDELNSVVDHTNTLGFTPLMVAARRGDLAVVQALIDVGADVDAVTAHNKASALILACKSGAVDVMNTLIDNGADVESRDIGGMTPLMHATVSRRRNIVDALMEQMPDLEDRDESGRTPLLHAARWGDLDIVKLYVREGADMDVKGKLGWNALMLAARWGHVEVIDFLLTPRKVEGQPGKRVWASLDAYDYNNGRTALAMAVEFKRTAVVTRLLDRGAYRLRHDVYGVTPLVRVQGLVDAIDCEVKLRTSISEKLLLSKIQRSGVRLAKTVALHSRCNLKKGGRHVQVTLRLTSTEWMIFGDDEEVAVERAVAGVLGIEDEEVRVARVAEDEIAPTRTDGSDWIVAVEREGRIMKGAVRFVGQPTFADKSDKVGLWIGVQLAHPAGDSDGTVNGVHYFNCNQNYGCWVRPYDLMLVTKSVDVVMKKRHGRTLAEERKLEAEAKRLKKEAEENAARAAEEVIRQRQAAAMKFAAAEASGGAAVAAALYADLDEESSEDDDDEAAETTAGAEEQKRTETDASSKTSDAPKKRKPSKSKKKGAAASKESDGAVASKEGDDDDDAAGGGSDDESDDDDDESKDEESKTEIETEDETDDDDDDDDDGEGSEDFEAPVDGKEDDDDRMDRLERKLRYHLRKEKKKAEALVIILAEYWPFERGNAATKIACWFRARRSLSKYLLDQARKGAATALQKRVKVWSGRAPGKKYSASAKIQATYRGLKKRGFYSKAQKKSRRKKKAAAAKKARLAIAKANKKAAGKAKKAEAKAAKKLEKANKKKVSSKAKKKKVVTKKKKGKGGAAATSASGGGGSDSDSGRAAATAKKGMKKKGMKKKKKVVRKKKKKTVSKKK